MGNIFLCFFFPQSFSSPLTHSTNSFIIKKTVNAVLKTTFFLGVLEYVVFFLRVFVFTPGLLYNVAVL